MTTASQEWDKSHLSTLVTALPLNAILVAPENDLLYDKFGIANADDWALVQSIWCSRSVMSAFRSL